MLYWRRRATTQLKSSALLAAAVAVIVALVAIAVHRSRTGVDQDITSPVTERVASLLGSEVEDQAKVDELLHFSLSNATTSSRTLTLVSQSCSCYRMEADGAPMMVGQSIDFDPSQSRSVGFKTGTRLEAGDRSYAAVFRSDRGTELTLAARVHVRDNVTVAKHLYLANLDDGQPDGKATLRITIQRVARAPSRLAEDPTITHIPKGLRLSGLAKVGEARLVEPGLREQAWEAVVELRADAVETAMHSLTFGFRDLSAPRYGATVHVRVQSAESIRCPKDVYFGTLTKGAGAVRWILVQSERDQPFRILRTKSSMRGLRVDPPSGSGARRYLLKITIDPSNFGHFDDALDVETDDERSKSIRVRIHGDVRDNT
jgi:hypothetical protein